MRRFVLVSVLLCCSISSSVQQQNPGGKAAEVVFASPSLGKGAPVTSKVVDAAPEAVLANGVDDIDAAKGKCKAIAQASCKDVEVGEGRVAECISQLIDAMEAPDAADESKLTLVPEDCQEEVFQYFIARNKNINKNVPLAKACKADVAKVCNSTWLFGKQDGAVIGCLRENKAKLSAPCQDQVFKVQQQAANDMRSDVQMAKACADDARKLCADVKPGAGRIQACLRDKRVSVSWECQQQLFLQEEEADDDIRLSVRLFHKCLADKKRFCAEVPPNTGAVKDCLVDHRQDNGFSPACREELEAMVERRVQDFRLDSRLRRVCATDMHKVCGTVDDMDDAERDIGVCLQDYVAEISDEGCRAMVKRYQELAAEDVRFDVPLAEACAVDRQKLCGNVPPGSARVFRCLQKDRTKLSKQCRAVLFDEEQRFSENIDFQYPMKKACEKEMASFCKDVPHGNARVIKCLQEHKGRKDFGSACAAEVKAYEEESSQDYRLNYRLRTHCAGDIESLCAGACKLNEAQMCGGTMLRCLTDRREDIKGDACRKEVLYFIKMEVHDFHNDVILASACRDDVNKHCKNVPSGDGAVHACLREHSKKLSDSCRREELILEETESEHIELRPSLLKACSDERGMFCKNVRPGGARVFRCLTEKLADADFGNACREEIIKKLQRRQANWKLDPALRKACKADVVDLCKAEDAKGSEQGLVYKCLVANYDDLDSGCRAELGRAVHMAFFVWRPSGVLTQPCDDDVKAQCLSPRPNLDSVPGQVGKCLADVLDEVQSSDAASRKALKPAASQPARSLTDGCRALVDVAEPPKLRREFDTSLSLAFLDASFGGLESTTGLTMLERDRRGNARALTLTGWSALLGVVALAVLLLLGGWYGYRSYYRLPPGGGTVVLKTQGGGAPSGQRYSRVSASAD